MSILSYLFGGDEKRFERAAAAEEARAEETARASAALQPLEAALGALRGDVGKIDLDFLLREWSFFNALLERMRTELASSPFRAPARAVLRTARPEHRAAAVAEADAERARWLHDERVGELDDRRRHARPPRRPRGTACEAEARAAALLRPAAALRRRRAARVSGSSRRADDRARARRRRARSVAASTAAMTTDGASSRRRACHQQGTLPRSPAARAAVSAPKGIRRLAMEALRQRRPPRRRRSQAEADAAMRAVRRSSTARRRCARAREAAATRGATRMPILERTRTALPPARDGADGGRVGAARGGGRRRRRALDRARRRRDRRGVRGDGAAECGGADRRRPELRAELAPDGEHARARDGAPRVSGIERADCPSTSPHFPTPPARHARTRGRSSYRRRILVASALFARKQ